MKISKKKPYRLDRVVAGAGRIQRSTGTRDRRLVRELNKMVDQLRDYRRLDILTAIRDGDWSLQEVYERFVASGANPNAIRLERAAPLKTEIKAWFDSRKRLNNLSKTTLQMYDSCMHRITQDCADTAKIDDLAQAVGRVQKKGKG